MGKVTEYGVLYMFKINYNKLHIFNKKIFQLFKKNVVYIILNKLYL